MADQRPGSQPPGGRRPTGSGEICVLLLILLLLFFWPVGVAYAIYKSILDKGERNSLNEFVWWAEDLFGGTKSRRRGNQGPRAGAMPPPRQQWTPPRQQGQQPQQQARPQTQWQQPPQAQQPPVQPQPQPQQAQPQSQQPPVQPRPQPQQAQPVPPPPPQGQTPAGSGRREGRKEERSSSAPREKRLSLGGATALWITGACLLFSGAVALASEIESLLYGYLFLEDLVAAALIALSGTVMILFGHRKTRAVRRARKYLLAIGTARSMELDEIAKRVGRGRKKVVRELQKLIERGLLGDDAYLDLEAGYFLRYGAKVTEPEKAEVKADREAEQPEGRYGTILRDIRAANDRIDDEDLSAKIHQLERITAQILKEISEHPEKEEKMHTFFDYYLPTTQRLLDTYADFEEAGVEGENLREAKQRIESTMDGIVEGFARQLDSLYKTDVMDVESDIRVMESMLRRDSASAARDFGGQQVQEK